MLNFWEIIFLFFSFQALLMAIVFFFKKKGDKTANILLGVYLLLFAINIGYNVLYWSKLMFTMDNIHSYGILTSIWISYAPLIYLYVRRVITQEKLKVKDLIHAIPLVIVTLLYTPFYILSPSEKLEILTTGRLIELVPLLIYIFPFTIALMYFYLFLSYMSFKKKNLGINKNIWLKWVIGCFTCYVISMTSYYVLSRLGLINTAHDYFITYAIVLFIGLVTYFGLMQPDVFDGLSMNKIIPFIKYKNTGLTPSHSAEIKSNLLALMKTEKPYLKSDIRLDDLSEKLNLSRHHTSQVINEHFDTNFFDFINSYRIEECKHMLISNDNLNISDIIYSSGFNNRVSFYNTFKKYTGMTPTQYKTQHTTS